MSIYDEEDTHISYRDYYENERDYCISDILLKASESSLKTEEERRQLEQYKMLAKQIEYESESINIYSYQEPIRKRINDCYHQLYLLEHSKPLQDVLERENEKKLAYDREVQRIEKEREQSMKKSERILFWHLILMSLSINLPLIVMDAPTWLLFLTIFIIFSPLIFVKEWLFIIIMHLYNIARVVLYVVGVIVSIQGKQDFIAIAFYIITALQVFNMIKNLLFTIGTIIAIIDNK